MSKTIYCQLAASKPSLGTQYVSLGAIIFYFDLVGIEKQQQQQQNNSGDFTQISRLPEKFRFLSHHFKSYICQEEAETAPEHSKYPELGGPL